MLQFDEKRAEWEARRSRNHASAQWVPRWPGDEGTARHGQLATVSMARREVPYGRCQSLLLTPKRDTMQDPANILSFDGILRNGSLLVIFSGSRVL